MYCSRRSFLNGTSLLRFAKRSIKPQEWINVAQRRYSPTRFVENTTSPKRMGT